MTTGTAGYTADAGHRQIEQDQVDIRILLKQRGQFIERTGFVNSGRGHDTRDRLSQGIAEQRMVIGNDEMRAGGGSHLSPAKGLRPSRDRVS
jgi:hypothetical protein